MKRKIIAWLALTSLFIPNFTFANTNLEIDSANFLASKWIISDKSFSPSDYRLSSSVLRQEIAAVTLGVARMPKNWDYRNTFSDVTKTSPNNWAWKSINALRLYDIISENPTFRPESKITKSEAVGMIVKAAYNDEYKFDYTKGGTWQSQVVDFAVSKGLVKNFTDYDAFATRWFVFIIAANALKNNPELANAQPCFAFNKKTQTIFASNILWDGCSTDVVIPKKILWVQVRHIWDRAFDYYTPTITSVIFPEWLESIWEGAFLKQKIQKLDLPSTMIEIKKSAFSHNYSLSEVNFNDWIKVLWANSFNSTSLKKVTIPKNTEYTIWWWNAFWNYNYETEIYLK